MTGRKKKAPYFANMLIKIASSKVSNLRTSFLSFKYPSKKKKRKKKFTDAFVFVSFFLLKKKKKYNRN